MNLLSKAKVKRQSEIRRQSDKGNTQTVKMRPRNMYIHDLHCSTQRDATKRLINFSYLHF